MARVYDIKNREVTTAWEHVASNPSESAPSIPMACLVEVLNQWHEEHRKQFIRDGYTNLLESFDEREEKHAHVGAVYVRLDVGGSGAWMLEIETGNIFQIKGYGKVDKKKCVGNIMDADFNGTVLHRDRFRHGRFDNRIKVEAA